MTIQGYYRCGCGHRTVAHSLVPIADVDCGACGKTLVRETSPKTWTVPTLMVERVTR